MQRFQFRLASVLKWRGLQLDVEKSKLQALFGERNRAIAGLARLEDCRLEANRILAAGSVDGQSLAALGEYRSSLQRSGEKIRAAAADCERRIAAQQQCLAEAERRVRLLERLKERRLEEWNREAARELEALASETFLAKWVREAKA
ncbi:MAG TPA: flagellar FliJ family protein [Bryobacteraceae bacterium]